MSDGASGKSLPSKRLDVPVVVLLSGGLDSTTVLAEAVSKYSMPHALTIHYGQRHQIEREAARRVARAFNVVRHVELEVDLRAFGRSALTDDLEVPKDRSDTEIARGIPITYVPARNTIFLSLALAFAESIGSTDLFVGVNCVDYSGYPDCRPEYLRAFEALANLATKVGVEGTGRFRVHAPFLHATKADIIRRGLELGVDYSLTHSCYDPDDQGRACGRCDSCRLRLAAFRQVGRPDPAPYQPGAV
ncbi:preQ(0) biosynthesis protein QueC [Isosphaera pallida ATCC 43644]|uniref:7-cyano-7-deazaguanine synthase n=1 Tax=Isosphaera pallida (strain ATCC 43644 / DSM 9630 / IS1B) TaxID=575540 RepID=E8R0T0_ISOPI|nr:7-cyano-7-deazaguanine synthase QueC [Isosphaera pallida]ADV62276.1 preQ(0) biosynthesis protein QueC [Isosphaera pallida ATCC 43644]